MSIFDIIGDDENFNPIGNDSTANIIGGADEDIGEVETIQTRASLTEDLWM